MYGKIFDSIYDGTLYGHWEAIVTMQQLIVLSNADGVVDMTPQAIAARTSIPLEIILKGLKVLSEPDPYTRTPGEDGRRIVMIDEHRPWGWRLVNHAKYARLRDMKQKRQADKERIAEKRKKNKYVAIESQGVANVAHAYADADVKNKAKPPPESSGPVWGECLAILTGHGLSEPVARGFLGLMCKDYAEHDVIEAVKAATGKANPTAYVRGFLRQYPKKGERKEPKVAMP